MKTKQPKFDRSKVEIYKDSDGWWANYPAGWCSANDPQCHSDHEDTKRELLACVRAAVPCTCRECKG